MESGLPWYTPNYNVTFNDIDNLRNKTALHQDRPSLKNYENQNSFVTENVYRIVIKVEQITKIKGLTSMESGLPWYTPDYNATFSDIDKLINLGLEQILFCEMFIHSFDICTILNTPNK